MTFLRSVANLFTKRNFMKTSVRKHDHGGDGGVPGENLPFRIDNRYRMLFVTTVYALTGYGLPFLQLRYDLLK